MLSNQKGFAQVLALAGLFVLAASLGAGIYLVKQRTNVAPQAEELRSIPSTTITGESAPAGGQIPNFPFQLPDFIANLVPTPNPVPSGAGPTPTVSEPTSTPNPTLIPTFFPTPTLTPTPTLSPTVSPAPTTQAGLSPTPTTTVSIPTLTPIPTTASLEGRYRVSFDSNFNSLIDTGDGGIFGSGNEKTINLTLTGGPGQKYVYIQFFENGSWTPSTPLLASINLVSSSADTHTAPPPTPTTNPVFEQNRQQAIENLPNPGQPDYTIQPLAVGEPGGPPGPSGAPPTSLVGWRRFNTNVGNPCSSGEAYWNENTNACTSIPPLNVNVADGIWSIGESGPVFIPNGWAYVGGGRYLPGDESFKRQVIETRRMLGL